MADTPDWGALAQADSAYVPEHGANKNAILALIRNFGQSSALSPQEAAAYGITPADLAGVDDNPYSTVKNLAKTLITNNYGITNNAAAHGAEFSGAHDAQLLNQRDAAQQRNYDATQSLNSGVLGVDTTDASQYGSAIQNLMNNYVPPAPAPAPTPYAPAATPAVYGQPDTPVVSAGGATNTYNAQAPQNQLGPAPKPPKVKLATGLQGHL